MSGGEDATNVGRRRARYAEVVTVETQGAARARIAADPSVLAVVTRGRLPRSVVFACPCGCGEVLALPVDPAHTRPWRLRVGTAGLTLMPSVWRTTGCRSHFILWNGEVWWCSWDPWDDPLEPEDARWRDEGAGWPAELREALRTEWRRIREAGRRGEGKRS